MANLTTDNVQLLSELDNLDNVSNSDKILLVTDGIPKTTTVDKLIGNKLDKNNPIIGSTKCKVTYDEKGLVTEGSNLEVSDLPENIPQSKISNLGTSLGNKVTKNADITGATKCKITYDNKGLVTKGSDLEVSDLPENIPQNKILNLSTDLNNKVDKENGKSLVSNSDITQITTNKDNINNLQTTVGDNSSGLIKQVNDIRNKLESINITNDLSDESDLSAILIKISEIIDTINSLNLSTT